MASWSKQKTDAINLHGGQEYSNGNIPDSSSINVANNNAFYAVDFVDRLMLSQEYSSATTYLAPTIVYYNGNAYMCISNTPILNTVPTNTTYWTKIVDKGEQGQRGNDGINGQKGEQGTSLRFRGSYLSSETYYRNSEYIDVVEYLGSNYCISSNYDYVTNVLPTNATYWNIYTSKGADGVGAGNVYGTNITTVNTSTQYAIKPTTPLPSNQENGTLSFVLEPVEGASDPNKLDKDFSTFVEKISISANDLLVIQDSESTSTPKANKKVKADTLLNNKVDKVTGKGLSTNDYTTAEKTKLAGIANNANNYVLPNASTAQVGGIQIATDAEITTGTNTTKAVTPTQLKALANVANSHIASQNNPHTVTKSQIGLGNVDNVRQYSTSNPPPYPVTSVNNSTGAVSLGELGIQNATNVYYQNFNDNDHDSGWYKIKINYSNPDNLHYMLAFTLRLYAYYKWTDIVISGYNNISSNWHLPKAKIYGEIPSGGSTVHFGYDGTNQLWVAIPAAYYGAIAICNVACGYRPNLLTETGIFSIEYQSTLTGTIQTTFSNVTAECRMRVSGTTAYIRNDGIEP